VASARISDIPANTIYRLDPKTKRVAVFRQPSGHANGNLFDLQNRLITCEHDGRVSRTERDGSIVTLAARYQGKRLNSPNDAAIRSDGSIYFTDPPYGIRSEQEELGFYGIYRLSPRGELTLLDKSFKRPNGIAFSPVDILPTAKAGGFPKVLRDGSRFIGRCPAQRGCPAARKILPRLHVRRVKGGKAALLPMLEGRGLRAVVIR